MAAHNQIVKMVKRLLRGWFLRKGIDPAAKICPSPSATASAASSISPPRAVLINTAEGFIIRSCILPIMPFVRSFSGRCSEIKSQVW